MEKMQRLGGVFLVRKGLREEPRKSQGNIYSLWVESGHFRVKSSHSPENSITLAPALPSESCSRV